jgi:formylglycine-generating enzyme required for sulfatase activity
MIFIPGGFFEMGASAASLLEECNTFREGCESDWFAASEPAHLVLVAPYYLDAHEVTNEAFVAFLETIGTVEGACSGQLCLDFNESRIAFADNTFSVEPELLNHPVAGVTWYGASTYCEWRGSRLPTDAEWEYAAGWDSRNAVKTRYPWGESFDGQRTNFCDANCDAPQANPAFDDGYAATAPVLSYEAGRSPSGIYDMAGNVWEWVFDWYAADFYSDAIFTNPVGPDEGEEKVVRGGSWFDTGNFTSTVIRFPSSPTNADKTIGFRCAQDLPRP